MLKILMRWITWNVSNDRQSKSLSWRLSNISWSRVFLSLVIISYCNLHLIPAAKLWMALDLVTRIQNQPSPKPHRFLRVHSSPFTHIQRRYQRTSNIIPYNGCLSKSLKLNKGSHQSKKAKSPNTFLRNTWRDCRDMGHTSYEPSTISLKQSYRWHSGPSCILLQIHEHRPSRND